MQTIANLFTNRNLSAVRVESGKLANHIPSFQGNYNVTEKEKDFYDSNVKITSLAEQKRISESTKRSNSK